MEFDDGEREESLWQAAGQGNTEEVLQLLNQGVNPNCKHWNSLWTPLHFAAEKGHLFVVEILIKKGAKANYKSKWGCTPLHGAAISGDLLIGELLIANGAEITAQIDGTTPLHQAAEEGHFSFVKFLVERGAEVTAKDREAQTPLDRGTYHKQIKDFLRNHQSNMEISISSSSHK
eukprot:TRINITY_DN3364_c0_g3_i1.p1 TRINITY_DN3364_c0_g3~~TRINITY_DN3364_c0_g3_i1.p1  ORF type:complete len:175 (+),score=40.71 TRINITY_DN3364_c0_g3_i1:136-660(+)